MSQFHIIDHFKSTEIVVPYKFKCGRFLTTYLSVMLEPLGCDLWDGIVLVLWACRDSSEIGGGTESH